MSSIRFGLALLAWLSIPTFAKAAHFTTIDLSPIEGIPLLPVDYQASLDENSKNEIRTFVTSDLDPMGSVPEVKNRKALIFGRMVPQGAMSGAPIANPKQAPTIFLVHGGPAFSSEWYTLSFAWKYPTPENPNPDNTGLVNSLKDWNLKYNVVILDQRGSPGKSVPMDERDQSRLDYSRIARLFNATTLAFDLEQLIRWYVDKGYVDANNFYVLGHSFGEIVMWNYTKLIQNGLVRDLPKGMIGASGNKLFADMREQWLSTRKNLETYNLRVQEWSKQNGQLPFDQIITALQLRLTDLGYNPVLAYNFAMPMADSMNEMLAVYTSASTTLADFSDPTKDPKEVYETFLKNKTARYMYLNAIMSPGLFGNTTIESLADEFGSLSQSWMQNYLPMWKFENDLSVAKIQKIFEDGGYEVPSKFKVSVEDVRQVAARVPIVLQWGTGDILVSSPEQNRKIFDTIRSPNVLFVESVDKAHSAIKEGAELEKVMSKF